MANHKKSESYKAVLNFFRNTLGYDRQTIGQLVRYAVDRIAKNELGYYLRSNKWLDKVGGRKELNSLIVEAIRMELRSQSADWIDRQIGSVRAIQHDQSEAKKALADLKAAVDCIDSGMDRDSYNKLLASLSRLEELL